MILVMSIQTEEAAIPLDTLQNRLVLARMHAGHLSIREASMRCGLGRGAWQNWEAPPTKGNASSPRIDDLRAIATHLGVSLAWLVEGGPLAVPAPDTDPDGAECPRQDSNLRHTVYYAGGSADPRHLRAAA